MKIERGYPKILKRVGRRSRKAHKVGILFKINNDEKINHYPFSYRG
jgi:hypothetical protein